MPVKLVCCFKTMFPFAKFIFANKFLRNFAFFAKIFVCWKPYYVSFNADEGIPP